MHCERVAVLNNVWHSGSGAVDLVRIDCIEAIIPRQPWQLYALSITHADPHGCASVSLARHVLCESNVEATPSVRRYTWGSSNCTNCGCSICLVVCHRRSADFVSRKEKT